jgi:hypothetical protein
MSDVLHNRDDCAYYVNGRCSYYCPAAIPPEVKDITKGFDCEFFEPEQTDCIKWTEK